MRERVLTPKRRVYLAWFLLHCLLIITISAREIFWLIAHRLTILPTSFSSTSRILESIASTTLAQNLASSNPVRRALLAYLHVTGIERGYGYFAPNVPHQEANLSASETVDFVVVRSDNERIVVKLEVIPVEQPKTTY